jgi:signal transduction histidine kinase
LERAVALTDSEIGFFHRVSDNQREIALVTWNKGARKACAAAFDEHYPVERAGNWADSLREKRPVVYNDYPSSPNRKGLPEGHAPVRRFMSIPVIEDGKVRLILGVGNKALDYDKHDVDNLQLVANELHKIMTLRRLNAELRQTVSQLRASNAELESFAYSVSHDLRAPLRAMDGFAQALQEEHGDRLDGTGREYLEKVRAASARMSTLIDDLLGLSRVTRADMRRESVDLSALAAQTLNGLSGSEPGRKVRTGILAGQVVDGDPDLLRLMMENLLSNAWKYTSRTDQAFIEFGAETVDGKRVFFVRDNGVGFDMKYAGKLFGPFQRLHSTADFPGTGIGLATVQRVVHRHGGKVWAESAPGKGATFKFTIEGG